jgi:hypothetical protein
MRQLPPRIYIKHCLRIRVEAFSAPEFAPIVANSVGFALVAVILA